MPPDLCDGFLGHSGLVGKCSGTSSSNLDFLSSFSRCGPVSHRSRSWAILLCDLFEEGEFEEQGGDCLPDCGDDSARFTGVGPSEGAFVEGVFVESDPDEGAFDSSIGGLTSNKKLRWLVPGVSSGGVLIRVAS